MNVARLTGWTPRQIMWEISFPTLMKMLQTVEAPSTDEDGETIGPQGKQATPFLAAATMGMQIHDFTKDG